jgi:hypothetical protein
MTIKINKGIIYTNYNAFLQNVILTLNHVLVIVPIDVCKLGMDEHV